ncbi:nucleotidyltransferase [Candidatus Woesearchaeota archaeon]|nr:nucleotidyltransferase [Candidatus Woesearchaeota archaeon]
MINLGKQEELFLAIGERLKHKIECYVIGGSAMMYYGVKENTKDIDLVFLNISDRDAVVEILQDIGFLEKSTRLLYARKRDVPLLFEFGEARIDLFIRKIICFKVTDEMINRVNKVYEYSNLTIKIVMLEDIILLKSATERAGDRIDVKAILEKTKIDWNIIIGESIRQTKIGDSIFPVFLYDFLVELKEDLKVDIPKEVILKIMKIAEKEMIKAKKKGKLIKEEKY